MRVAEVATRALLGATLALPQNAVTPNPSGLQVRQTGGCGTLEKACGTGCISTLSSCCDTQGGYCGVSQYCTDDGGCCDRGKVCTGPITCDAGQKLCGTK
ncbi:hypothetical protein C8A05DRAFT_38089 [Staphylotrichum tortipilum]|uniref:Uncharacterized protein n=1 Tax=Staphylotrichum tortipilum TaxID=2831512 RepID=A0AAN6RPS8_9PEZI|nr:hypothetical protein C8A05DRAFT_38089 [Staphylotrichum longicolle]